MSTRVFRFTIKIFWVDDKKYGNDLIETIDFYDELDVYLFCCIFLMFHGDNPIHKCCLFYLYI
jgi:hypothetical protein